MNSKNYNGKERVTVTLEANTHSLLNEIAGKGDVSISWVIRYAVDNFLKEWRQGQHQSMSLPLERANGKAGRQ